MKGHDCLILDIPGQGPVIDFARAALGRDLTHALISLEELTAIQPKPDAEMGILIVPAGDRDALGPACAMIRACRDAGAHLGVLALTPGCIEARALEINGVFDSIVSIAWTAAESLIWRFAENCRVDMQNRAFRAYLDHSADGYWIWNIESDRLEWSERTRQMTSTRPEAVPKDMAGFANTIHPRDLDRVQQAIRNHLDHHAPYDSIEMRLRNNAGGYGHFLASGQALRDETGRAIMLVGSLTDRTLIQHVEQKLEDTQKRFTVLFHQMNDAAVLADIETGIILEANQPAERLWGRSISELVGAHQSDLHPATLSDESRQAFADHVAALMRNRRDTIHVPILRADGQEIPAEISSSLIEIDGKTMILGVFRDISDRVRAARELRERDAQIQLSSHLASMGTLAAGVAHEINNPLTYVLGNLELLKSQLQRHPYLDRSITEAIEAATIGGRFVQEIVSDLKAISRIDSSDDSCDPAEVLRIASRMAIADLRHRARFEMQLEEVPRVPLSAARLSQVMLNLLSNAVRAFASSDRNANHISLSVRREGEEVRIVLADNGRGISPEDLRRVWQPFFSTHAGSGGTGLGLSISRRILQEAGGTLELASTPGEGTRVEITLPVATGPGSTPDAPAPADPPQTPRRHIMVVDDDAMVTGLIQRMLERHHDITVFNDARAALAALEGGARFDLALCDLMMPDLDGARFHEAAGHRLPFLFLTGGAVTVDSMAFEKEMLRQNRLMHKPFREAELRQRITALLHDADQPEQPPPAQPPEVLARPDPEVLHELESLLGREALHGQFVELARQLGLFIDQLPDLPDDDRAQTAHRLAGAADMLGLCGIGRHLRDCQRPSPDGGDRARIRGLLATLRALHDALGRFIAEYRSDGTKS